MADNFTIDDLKERLQQRQNKLTKQRKIVLEIFLENQDKHLSADDVYDLLRNQHSDIGLATVYRSLELLCELEILQKVDFGDGCSRYEIGTSEPDTHQHHHLICQKCGKVTEFSEDMLDELESVVSKKFGFKITDHQVKLIGYCKECQ